MEGVPDRVGVVEAWRFWRYREGPRLGSVCVPAVWTPLREFRAKCAHESLDHRAPNPDCLCGIYALKTLATGNASAWRTFSTAWGRVALWGKIIEGEIGYRAEFAYPLDLRPVWPRPMPHSDLLSVRDLAETYQVPFVNETPFDHVRKISRV